jgi:hypothetical protein
MNLLFNVFQNGIVCSAGHISQAGAFKTGSERRYKTETNGGKLLGPGSAPVYAFGVFLNHIDA